MFGLTFFIFLCLSAHAVDIGYWSATNDHDDLVDRLTSHGFTIQRQAAQVDLKVQGEWKVDGLIIELQNVDETEILEFVNSGHSVVIILPEDSEVAQNFLPELGIDASSDYTDAIKCTYYSPMQNGTRKDVTCGGVKLDINKTEHAEYYNLTIDDQGNTYAVAAQGKNDARIVVFGGEMFGSDEEDTSSFNTAVELLLWAFHKSGVMRARDLRYVRLADGDINPPELTISDDIEFSIVLETYDSEKQAWLPYDADDVQVDFTMLVPRIRKTIPSLHNGTFSRVFKLPDIFGVYQFILDYHARGYTPLNVTHQLMLHPRRHDEQPRFVKSAYPFYTAAGVMGVAVSCLIVIIARSAPIFLQAPTNAKDEDSKAKATKKSQKEKTE